MDPEALKAVIYFIYTSQPCLITKENFAQVLLAADFLQVDLLKAWDFAKVRLPLINTENLIEIMEIAEKINSGELKKQAWGAIEEPQDFVELLLYAKYREENNSDSVEDIQINEPPIVSLRENYTEALNHPYFLLIDDVDELEFIINPVWFAKKKEWHIEIFKAIVKWIKHKEDRGGHADQLFQHVCIDAIHQDVLKGEVLPVVERISSCKEFKQEVTEYLEEEHKIPFLAMKSYGTGSYGRPYGYSYLNERRVHGFNQPVMYVFGGKGHTVDEHFTDSLAFSQELTQPWRPMSRKRGHTHTLGYWPVHMGLAIMEPKGDSAGCFAFVAGGYTQQGENKMMTPSDQFFCYQMLTGEKLELTKIPKATCWHEVVVHVANEEVWVLGGIVQEGSENVVTKSTHIYDSNSSTWKSGPDLPGQLCQFGACYTPTKTVMISGGRTTTDGTTGLATVYIYRAESTSWEKLPNMTFPRYSHTMAAFFHDEMIDEARNEIYVVGGRREDGQYQVDIEVYKMNTQQWTCFGNTLLQRSIFGVYTRRWKAELITFSEDDDGQTVMQIMSSLQKMLEPDWRDIATLKLPFSLKGTLVLPCVQELYLEDPPLGTTIKKMTCSTCNSGPSAYHQAINQA